MTLFKPKGSLEVRKLAVRLLDWLIARLAAARQRLEPYPISTVENGRYARYLVNRYARPRGTR